MSKENKNEMEDNIPIVDAHVEIPSKREEKGYFTGVYPAKVKVNLFTKSYTFLNKG